MAITSRIFSSLFWYFVAVLSVMLVGITDNQAAEPKWPKSPYKYIIVDQDIKDVLAEFGRNLNLPISVSKAIKGRRIRNSSAVLPPREFLKRICNAYGMVWYFDGAVLHINGENEIRTELINVSPSNPTDLIDQISALGVSDKRYEVHPGAGAGIISVSGPPPFLSMIKKTVSALKQESSPLRAEAKDSSEPEVFKVRVFRGAL